MKEVLNGIVDFFAPPVDKDPQENTGAATATSLNDEILEQQNGPKTFMGCGCDGDVEVVSDETNQTNVLVTDNNNMSRIASAVPVSTGAATATAVPTAQRNDHSTSPRTDPTTPKAVPVIPDIASAPLASPVTSSLRKEKLEPLLLKEIESAFEKYLTENPGTLSSDPQQIRSLRDELVCATAEKARATTELMRQLEQVRNAREKIESLLQRELLEAARSKATKEAELFAQLESMKNGDKKLGEAFVNWVGEGTEELIDGREQDVGSSLLFETSNDADQEEKDHSVTVKEGGENDTDAGDSKVQHIASIEGESDVENEAVTSERAATAASPPTDVTDDATTSAPAGEDRELKAYRVDNALLTAEVEMLRKKLEQEKMKESNREKVDALLNSLGDDIVQMLKAKREQKADDVENSDVETSATTQVVVDPQVKSLVDDEQSVETDEKRVASSNSMNPDEGQKEDIKTTPTHTHVDVTSMMPGAGETRNENSMAEESRDDTAAATSLIIPDKQNVTELHENPKTKAEQPSEKSSLASNSSRSYVIKSKTDSSPPSSTAVSGQEVDKKYSEEEKGQQPSAISMKNHSSSSDLELRDKVEPLTSTRVVMNASAASEATAAALAAAAEAVAKHHTVISSLTSGPAGGSKIDDNSEGEGSTESANDSKKASHDGSSTSPPKIKNAKGNRKGYTAFRILDH